MTNSNGGTVTVNVDCFGDSAGTVSFTDGAQIAAGGATVAVSGVVNYDMAEYNAAIKFKANATVFSQNGVVAKLFVISFAKRFLALHKSAHHSSGKPASRQAR